MNREEAICEINGYIRESEKRGIVYYDGADLNVLRFALTDMKICEANNAGWISVKDRLPKEDTEVLVTRYFEKNGKKKPYVEIASRIEGNWFSYTDEWKMDITAHSLPYAWMPLPKPPEEESDE